MGKQPVKAGRLTRRCLYARRTASLCNTSQHRPQWRRRHRL